MPNAVNNDNHNLITLIAAAAQANSADQKNYGCRGVKVIVNLTVISAGTLTVTIKGKDPVSGQYFTILASAAIAAPSVVVLTVFPGAPATANVSANDQIPATWRVEAVPAGGNSTATIAASNLL